MYHGKGAYAPFLLLETLIKGILPVIGSQRQKRGFAFAYKSSCAFLIWLPVLYRLPIHFAGHFGCTQSISA